LLSNVHSMPALHAVSRFVFSFCLFFFGPIYRPID
jgi:hypothetical protein